MRRYIFIEFIMVFIAFLLLLSLAPMREMIRLNRKNYYKYEKQYVLQSSIHIDTYSNINANDLSQTNTLSAGTIINSYLINDCGELMGRYYVNEKGENIHINNRIPADRFKEGGLIVNDLEQLRIDKEEQINTNRNILITLAVISLVLSSIITVFTAKKIVKKNTYHVICICMSLIILFIVMVYLVGLFLVK